MRTSAHRTLQGVKAAGSESQAVFFHHRHNTHHIHCPSTVPHCHTHLQVSSLINIPILKTRASPVCTAASSQWMWLTPTQSDWKPLYPPVLPTTCVCVHV